MMRSALALAACVLWCRVPTADDNVTLPDPATDAGVIARLLLAECRTPAHPDYDVQARIDEVMKKANTGSPGKYARFVQNAIDVVNAPVSDPFASLTMIGTVAVTGGAYGWRTAGSSAPGGRFVAIPEDLGGIIAGNQFYALKP